MKYYKEFKEAHTETIGEKDHEFDMSNYIDWIDGKYAELVKNHGVSHNVSESLLDCVTCWKGVYINDKCNNCGASKITSDR